VFGQFAGFAETDDAGDVFGAAAPAAFLMSAGDERFEADAAADEENADAFGPVKFVSGERQEIDC